MPLYTVTLRRTWSQMGAATLEASCPKEARRLAESQAIIHAQGNISRGPYTNQKTQAVKVTLA